MTPVHSIMILIIRLWAAEAIISSILGLTLWPLLSPGSDGDGFSFAFYTYINGGVWVVIGVLAWVIAPILAKQMFAEKGNSEININIDAESLVTIGSFLIGGFYLVESAPTLITRAIYFLQETGVRGASGPLRFDTPRMEQLIITILIFFAACYLTFRSRDIARFFSKLRREGSKLRQAGLAKVKEEE